jgi:hypothetical protein
MVTRGLQISLLGNTSKGDKDKLGRFPIVIVQTGNWNLRDTEEHG